MKKNEKRYCTCFLVKYGGHSIYDIYFEKIKSICDKEIKFVKVYRYSLNGNTEHPYVT